jgi:hypothetical protein
VASNILLFFLQKEMKTKQKNNKILPATSACCGAVVRNECRDHFFKFNGELFKKNNNRQNM